MNTLRMLTTAWGQWLRLRRGAPAGDARSAEHGQVLAIFAVMSVVLLGGAALVTDATWWWTAEQQMQRAADAAALAGAVYLPNNESQAFISARAEAAKNGFTHGSGDVEVAPRRDPTNTHKLIVDIKGGVDTNFARVFGLERVAVGVTGAAVFVLPVPMGSPENYYGVFGRLRDATFTEPVTNRVDTDTGWLVPTTAVSGGQWLNPTRAFSENNSYATETANNETQRWTAFVRPSTTLGLAALIPDDPSVVIDGLQVRLTDVFLTGSGTSTNCQVRVETTWDGLAGTPPWSSQVLTTPALTATNTDDRTVGSDGATSVWGGHPWTRADFLGTNFQVRLTWLEGTAACPATRAVSLDLLEIRVDYHYTTTTMNVIPSSALLEGPGTPCSARTAGAPSDCFQPDGAFLNEQGFWGAMNTKGIQASDGDAFQSAMDHGYTNAPLCSTVSGLRNCYDPTNYYNYAIEMPAGSSGGYVYIFDPVFCEVASQKGTGDGKSSGGLDPANPPSSWYELFDTKNTQYTTSDDELKVTTGTTFRGMPFSDTSMGGRTGATECKQTTVAYGDERDYHNNWYLLNPGAPLSGGDKGRIYRLHTTNSTPLGQTDTINQLNVKTEQNFALYASATGGTPKIYGLGAMEMFSPLNAGASEFYLAQVPDAHAGKTLELNLWDPGDASGTATLSVLQPTSSGWAPINFDYRVSSPAAGCNAAGSRTGVGSVVTNTFNACWLTITIAIPSTYTAPQSGWWKIKYDMSAVSTDTTTWTARIVGNPVHLTQP